MLCSKCKKQINIHAKYDNDNDDNVDEKEGNKYISAIIETKWIFGL